MVVAPLRGIFALGRVAFIVAGAAAIPVLMKKNRKLADQVGNFMVKAGEGLKSNYGGATAVKEEPTKASENPASAVKSASAKPRATTSRASKPKATPKTAVKRKPASKPRSNPS
jgi:hypothetical protein